MILKVAISLLAVAGFALVLWRCRIEAIAHKAINVTMTGLSSMMDSELDDYAKEIAVRRAGFTLIGAGFSIFWRFFVALAVAAAPVFLADWIGLVSRDAVFALMLRWDYIIVVSIVAIAFVEIIRRSLPTAAKTTVEINRYSAADRFFHIVAFSSPNVLKASSWIEDRLLPNTAQDPAAPPIFITSLARAGTTALLNAFHDIPGIATHIYRDMPFLTAPHLWNRIAGGQKRQVDRHQRAHGDGLEIDLESPEAFEEVIWKMFWPEKYKDSSIELWQAEDRKPEAEQFLERHMSKVIGARLSQGGNKIGRTARYCSKNNANIARIPYLQKAFPGCSIIVPVRRPESHAASLLRQHQNFLKLQAEDDFIKRYMRDIGHFEFGQIHKPIEFPGFDAKSHDPATCDYWLNYWIYAFRHILENSSGCIFAFQDDLRSSPQATMTTLCSALDLEQGPMQFANYFRSHQDESRTDIYDERLFGEATELYRELERLALMQGE